MHCYDQPPLPPDFPEADVLRRYGMAPLRARAYLWIRLRHFARRQMWPVLQSLSGRVVSIGAGYGIFEVAMALTNPRVDILASDVDEARIRVGRDAAKGIPNLRFEVLDVTEKAPEETADTFLLMEVLHHLAPEFQLKLLRAVAVAMPHGGRIIIKECGTRPIWKMWFNYLNDAIGSPLQATYPRSEQEWASILERCGLSVTTARLDAGSPYADILIIGTKP
jgi:SAM-dependent methyltransferase